MKRIKLKYLFFLIAVLIYSGSEAQKLVEITTPTQRGKITKKKKQRVGVWEFYENGRLVLEYDYDVERVIFQRTTEDRSYFYLDDNEWIPVAQLEVYPRYKGSYLQFYETIYKSLRYPRKAQENMIEGISFLSFEVNESGQAINPEIHHSIGYGCDEEMMKVFNKTKDQWIVGVKDGKPIQTRFVVPFVFSFFGSTYVLNIDDELPPAALLDGVNITLISNKLTK